MLTATRPIGVFDSGIGGLTVVKNIISALPKENIIYFGDIARLPYGTKFAEQTVRFLLKQQVKAIVIACNTISAVAKDEICKLAGDIPVIDVISSGSEATNNISKNNNIGIIATPVTVNSQAYPKAIKNINKQSNVQQVACTLFVPLIEDGYINHPALTIIAKEYLEPLIANKIDTLVLGCTHYPLIKSTIQDILGDNVVIIDPANITCKKLVTILTESNKLNHQNSKPQYTFYVTEISPNFSKIGEIFLNTRLNQPILVNLD